MESFTAPAEVAIITALLSAVAVTPVNVTVAALLMMLIARSLAEMVRF